MQQMLGCLHCLFALFTFPLLCDGELGHYPEQVHLQLTKQPTEFLISDRRLSSYVHGSQKSFEVGGQLACVNYAKLIELIPGGTFWYQVSSGIVYKSRVIRAKASPPEYSCFTVGLIADIGTDNFAPLSIQAIKEDSSLDFVIAAGDLSYADTASAQSPEAVHYRTDLWDRFGRLLEGFASQVPFMTTIGNHEVDFEINAKPEVNFNPQSNPTRPFVSDYAFSSIHISDSYHLKRHDLFVENDVTFAKTHLRISFQAAKVSFRAIGGSRGEIRRDRSSRTRDLDRSATFCDDPGPASC
ncbi:uncharacterized protein LOC134191598 [Corticium candelabrum]|uniref:uncharacterized protein LOC134191598 n=1 Tax=Corticium candelabrum TaxID=121492 RepID=UPI002E273BA5|nr:uncharacterized protein LOC134191598 [Corticium candelabrum]